MKKKFLGKLLSMLLVVSMALTLLPVSAMAAYGGWGSWGFDWSDLWNWGEDDTQDDSLTGLTADGAATYAADSSKFRIVMLDCGRKYFSVDNIKKLIDTMAQYGYNQLQLSFGNGGLRFVLDDSEMGLTVGNAIYNGSSVVQNIKAGNTNFNGDERCLTQSEMDTIISYANSKGIDIVPMLNMPGHMEGILSSYSSYIDGNGNLNISNTEACNFAYALLTKYVDYFAGRGCKYFHFGADESKHTGESMTNFLAKCAEIIAGTKNSNGEYMIPRAFNDATKVATMPGNVQITYWTLAQNYNTNQVTSKTASELASENYGLINTHGRWYYVIKSYSTTDNSNKKYTIGTYGTASDAQTVMVELPTLKATKMDGSYVGIDQYFDSSSTPYGSTVSNSLGTMFCIWCDASQDKYLTSDQVISTDENYGALYQLQQLAKHYWPSDINEGGTDPVDPVDPVDPTAVNVNLTVGESVTFTVDSSVTAGQHITGNNAYIATAEVTHVDGVTETTVSTTKATTVEDGASYIIRYAGSNYALTTNTGKTDWNTKTLAFETYTAAEADNVWKLEASGTGYKLKSAAGYLMLGYNAAYTDTAGEVFTITLDNNSWKVMDTDNYCIDALGGLTNYYSAGGWKESGTRFDLYKVTEATEETSTLTITGTGENVDDGPLNVTVGNTTYNITVTAPNKTVEKALTHGSSFTLPSNEMGANITASSAEGIVTLSGSTITAGSSNGTAMVTCTALNDGGCVTAYKTYQITVSDITFTEDMNLTVELWVTNRHVPANGATHVQMTITDTEDDGCNRYSISARSAYQEGGVTLESLVPQYAMEETGDNRVLFWKATRHDSSTEQKHEQEKGEDTSGNGTDFTKIRFTGEVWQYLNGDNWVNVEDGDQIVAYYMQVYDTSPEIETAFRDYGNIAGKKGSGDTWTGLTGYTGLATAVVDQGSKSMSPDGDTAIYNNTLICYGANEDRLPGIIKVFDTENFRITKITLTHGTHQSDGSDHTTGGAWGTTDSVKWNKTTDDAGEEWYDETKVWDAETSGHIAGEPILLDETFWKGVQANGIDCAAKYCEAMLLLFYVEPVEKEDNLHIYYLDESDNNSNMLMGDGYLSVSVKSGTTFYKMDNKGDAVPETDGEFALNKDAAIESSVGSLYNINSRQLSLINNLKDSKYKSGLYQYHKAELSENGKVLKLYYTLDESKLNATYVLDFGLPVEIPLDTIFTNTDGISNVTWKNDPQYGGLKYQESKKVLTYTPTKVLTGFSALTFTVHFNGGGTQSIRIGVLPASNVLYEENFLTASATGSGTEWKKTSQSITTPQQTQKVGATGKYVFGYDTAYVEAEGNPVKGQLGVWSAKGLSATTMTGALTTSFYGNAFDLIGSCGSDTGRVMVLFTKSGEEKPCKGVIVDTRFSDSAVANTLYQVPWAHVELGEDAAYSVEIYASGSKGTSSVATRSVRAYSYAANNDAFESVLVSHGLTMADVEYINLSAADSIAVPAARRSAAAAYSAPAAYAATDTATVEHKAGTHVEIDGFRVYRSTDNTNYPTAEQNVTYWNILDVVKGNIVAYREGEGTESASVSVENYEKTGGPQNEIYLKPGQSVAFKLADSTIGSVQVSLRAVNGASSWNNTAISSNTEMYYTLSKDANGSFVISVPETATGMLAIGNVKLPSSVTDNDIVSASGIATQELLMSIRMAMNAAPVDPEPEQPAVFAPEYLDASVSTIRFFRNKLVTLTVSASADVAKLTVNGRELRPTNGWLVRMGWSDTYTYVLTDTVKKNDSRTYEIIAYDAAGLASAAKTVSAN